MVSIYLHAWSLLHRSGSSSTGTFTRWAGVNFPPEWILKALLVCTLFHPIKNKNSPCPAQTGRRYVLYCTVSTMLSQPFISSWKLEYKRIWELDRLNCYCIWRSQTEGGEKQLCNTQCTFLCIYDYFFKSAVLALHIGFWAAILMISILIRGTICLPA